MLPLTLQELGLPVEHIVLPTFAVEHKIFVGPFSRRFPKAKVWVAPRWERPSGPEKLSDCLSCASIARSTANRLA